MRDPAMAINIVPDQHAFGINLCRFSILSFGCCMSPSLRVSLSPNLGFDGGSHAAGAKARLMPGILGRFAAAAPFIRGLLMTFGKIQSLDAFKWQLAQKLAGNRISSHAAEFTKAGMA